MKRFLADMKKYGGYVVYAGKAELRAEVANSYLNWLWWIIEPFCFMLIYTFIFGYVFDASEDYFPAFVFIGITMWNFFSHMLNASVKAVKSSKSIISRTYLPKYILILIKLYKNGFKMMISFLIIFAMLLFYRIPLKPLMLWVFPIIIVMMIFTFGICTFLLHYGVYIEDLVKVVPIVLRMLFYMTGIFFNVEKRIGNRFGTALGVAVTKLNPMALVLSSTRKCLLYNEMPDFKWLAIWFVIGLILSVLGILKIYKNENSYVKVI